MYASVFVSDRFVCGIMQFVCLFFFVLPCSLSFLVGNETLALCVMFDLFVTAEEMINRAISTSNGLHFCFLAWKA